MGRRYTTVISQVTLPTHATDPVLDVFELTTPATCIAKIREVVIGFDGTADFGDAQAGGLDVRFVRGTGGTNSGSGGTTPTPVPHELGDPAAEVTVEAANTTIDTTATLTTLREEPFNAQVGFRYTPPEGLEYVLAPAERFIVRIARNVTNTYTTCMYASITHEEIGGA